MHMKLKSILTGGALALALSLSAFSQSTITGTNTDKILNIARGYGSATLVTQSNGDPQINGKIDGISYQIYFRNCTDNASCEDLNFYLGFLDLKPSLDAINTWNASKRFSRAYLDSVNDACVEMDIDMVKGVSSEYLDSQFGVWNMILNQFAEHVGYR
jgi:hypothetical protein